MNELMKNISRHRATSCGAVFAVLVTSAWCVPACRQDGHTRSQSAQGAQKGTDEAGRQAASEERPADVTRHDEPHEAAAVSAPEGRALDESASAAKRSPAMAAEGTAGGADAAPEESPEVLGQKPTTQAFKLHPVDVAAMAWGPEWKKITSLSAKVRATFVRLDEKEKHYATQGTRDLLKKDGKLLSRADLLGKATFKTGHEEMPWMMSGQKLTKFSDGRYLYIIDERPDKRMVTKNRSDHLKMPHLGGPRLFRVIRRLNDVERLPEEEIDGKRALGFVGTFGNGQGKAWHWIDYDTGLLLKMRVEYKGIKATFTYEVSDVEFDVDFSEDHFTFVPPEGSEVQDLTTGQPDTSDNDVAP